MSGRKAVGGLRRTDRRHDPHPKGLLGQVLVSRGVVTEAQLAAALKAQKGSGKRLGEVLVDIGALDERGLVDALADFFEMPVTDLRRDTPEPQGAGARPRGDGPRAPRHPDPGRRRRAPRGRRPTRVTTSASVGRHQRAHGPAVAGAR